MNGNYNTLRFFSQDMTNQLSINILLIKMCNTIGRGSSLYGGRIATTSNRLITFSVCISGVALKSGLSV